MDVTSNSDIPFEVAASSFCSSTHSDAPAQPAGLHESDQLDEGFPNSVDGPDQHALDRTATGSRRAAPIRLDDDPDPSSPSSGGRCIRL